MAADDSDDRRIFLDEWHVALFVPAGLDDAQAELARDQFGDALLGWATRRQSQDDRLLIVVDQ